MCKFTVEDEAAEGHAHHRPKRCGTQATEGIDQIKATLLIIYCIVLTTSRQEDVPVVPWERLFLPAVA